MIKIDDFQLITQNGMKFQRRNDLTFEMRLSIACIALVSKQWGIISQLAKTYAISRTFVYMLQANLDNALDGMFQVNEQPDKELATDYMVQSATADMLLYRLEGKCSIPAISDIMKRKGLNNCSVGSISQKLHLIGTYLPNTIEIGNRKVLYVYLAADEIFSHSRPLLISVDPISTAILRIELAESRKTEDWINHFNELKKNGIEVILSVSDEGKGICSAIDSSFPEINRQPDTFHAISHRLGKWVNSLEKAAYSAIAEEYRSEKVIDSAKNEAVMQKRLDAYLKAKTKADQAIILYEDYKFLYHCIINNLQVFDKEGKPCNREDAEENIRVALDYMIALPINKIKKEVNTIYNLLDNLMDYLDKAGQIVKNLIFKGIPQYIVQSFCLAWQYQKNAIKAKKSKRRKHFARKEKQQLEIMAAILNQNFQSIKESVYGELDKIVQSSAIVENVNSIVRAFLNTSRNKINQEMLNLIMFYHNHRRYKAGKRKGKTPMELLTGEKQNKDWLEMLMEITKESKSRFLAA